MAIPLLEYAPSSQNQRVAGFEAYGDEQARVFSTDNILSTTDMDALIEASYRQIFFHAFAADRERFLESQLRSGQITVRDFIRGLCLSRTFTGSFFNLNSNYRFVEHCINKVLGRAPYSEKEKIAWSIVIATKGRSAFINQLLDSDEYLTAFGDAIVPYQRRRTLPSGAKEMPFNLQNPRYNEYHRAQLGFPKVVWQTTVKRFTPQEAVPKAGSPANYLSMARSLNTPNVGQPVVSAMNTDMKKVPYRTLNY